MNKHWISDDFKFLSIVRNKPEFVARLGTETQIIDYRVEYTDTEQYERWNLYLTGKLRFEDPQSILLEFLIEDKVVMSWECEFDVTSNSVTFEFMTKWFIEVTIGKDWNKLIKVTTD